MYVLAASIRCTTLLNLSPGVLFSFRKNDSARRPVACSEFFFFALLRSVYHVFLIMFALYRPPSPPPSCLLNSVFLYLSILFIFFFFIIIIIISKVVIRLLLLLLLFTANKVFFFSMFYHFILERCPNYVLCIIVTAICGAMRALCYYCYYFRFLLTLREISRTHACTYPHFKVYLTREK